MGKTKGEKIIHREEIRKAKEHQKMISEANRMLIPTPKQTVESLGMISFDPAGAFRMNDNRWVKVYEVAGKKVNGSGITACDLKELHGRVRFTAIFGAGVQDKLYVSLMEEGEIYGEIRKLFEADADVLSKNFVLLPLSVDETMKVIMRDKEKTFSYASMVRGKKDWKECLPDLSADTSSLKINGSYAKAMFAMQFPSILSIDSFRSIKDIGCPMYLVCDISTETESGFLQALEKKYNRRLPKDITGSFMNLSLMILFSCDSDDARKIIEKTLGTMFQRAGIALSTSFGVQEESACSMITLGLLDYCVMRNVSAEAAAMLGNLGGALCLE